MKGHIAFCPHFHQPHFQLYKTREDAYHNSYLPWLNLLNNAVKMDGFYINVHLSGPLLYWMRDQKSKYINEFRSLLKSEKIGMIGGLADEPFVQLSSRSDDYLYQLRKYDELLSELTGVKSKDWQGVHIVERECGEILLKEVSYAANLMNFPAIFYLDAETFYESHFNYPGSDYDYCLKHFGFIDPVAKTTIGHIPQKLLYYAFRDEIVGQEFFSIPVHSQYRYHLLKRQSFTAEDKVKTKPSHYYFYIKDALENAYKMSEIYGRKIEPILLIFEDAEKLGQWSKDPQGDIEWLLEFFSLVCNDEELNFIGLKQYIDRCGYFDTYPVSLSHSYPEWENWTAKRGIRGVTYGDERLRRVICRLRDIEEKQQAFENQVIDNMGEKLAGLDTDINSIIKRSVLNSPERFELISKLLQYDERKLKLYQIINRVRNVVYQEDPKWASRHPSYGSSPYYDVTGLAYLEIANSVLKLLINKTESGYDFLVKDWDYDGQEEVLIENKYQTVVIDRKGGCISYHHVINPKVADSLNEMVAILDHDSKLPAYNSIYRHAYPIVFTETDSMLAKRFYHEGGRKEVSRNSYRSEVLVEDSDGNYAVGEFDTALFDIDSIVELPEGLEVKLVCDRQIEVNGAKFNISLRKIFSLYDNMLNCRLELEGDIPDNIKLLLSPQLVTSASSSDEIDFKPNSILGVSSTNEYVDFSIQDVSKISTKGIEYKSIVTSLGVPSKIDYLYQIKSADGNMFWNSIIYQFTETENIQSIKIEPAVKDYYKEYVFENQSSLGYHTSGVLINPYISVNHGKAIFEMQLTWVFDTKNNYENYKHVFNLIE